MEIAEDFARLDYWLLQCCNTVQARGSFINRTRRARFIGLPGRIPPNNQSLLAKERPVDSSSTVWSCIQVR